MTQLQIATSTESSRAGCAMAPWRKSTLDAPAAVALRRTRPIISAVASSPSRRDRLRPSPRRSRPQPDLAALVCSRPRTHDEPGRVRRRRRRATHPYDDIALGAARRRVQARRAPRRCASRAELNRAGFGGASRSRVRSDAGRPCEIRPLGVASRTETISDSDQYLASGARTADCRCSKARRPERFGCDGHPPVRGVHGLGDLQLPADAEVDDGAASLGLDLCSCVAGS
jgi:hypothetical protein